MSKKQESETNEHIPKAVVARLSLYLRQLQKVESEGKETISSTQLGKMLGITDAQVRKDFGYFGQFGYPGIGYRCGELIDKIREILGTNRIWPVALVGCGNMGQALIGYRGFTKQGFEISTAFDVDQRLIGTEIGGIIINDFEQIEEVLKSRQIRVAILSVPADSAQAVAERLVAAGIAGILNFAPVKLNLPAPITVVDVDLAVQLEQLSFGVVKSSES